VSSAIAAPAYAGIPLTHRKYSSSFAVIPGYEDATKERSSLRWEHLAQGVDTLVVLMAVRNIQELCAKLIQHGRAPETPVAVIRWGTRAEQSTLVSTLGRVAQEVRDREIKPPAVVVVGEVVRLREELQWFEKKPLFGHRVLITRESAEGFEPLESLGAEVMEFPCLQIHPPQDWAPLDAALERLKDYHWLVFQSANGVHYFMRRLLQLGRDVRALAHLRLSTVGPKTAQALRGYGLVADLQARSFRAEGLLQAFLEHTGGRLQGLRFLVPRAQEAREFFIQRLRELGAQVEDPVAYRALRPEARGRRLKRFLREGRITVAVFASGATFRNFLQILGPEEAQGLLQGVAIAALGPVTARAIRQAGLEVAISPREATVEALVEAITSWCLDNPRAPSVV
jgi:uroporphyrinogen III methyltransferase/synthase